MNDSHKHERFISVVIPTLNEATRLERAVSTAWSAGADEVIVVDGGSTDGTWELLEELECVPKRSATGRAAQQNAGARVARGDVLVFQHADNYFAADAFQELRHVLKRNHILSGAFRQRIDHDARKYRWVEWGNQSRVRCFGMAYGDQGIFVRRETFEQLGGFDDVPLMEDVLLMKRLRRLARPVLLRGPLHVDARRWEKHGVVRQTLRNWWILAAHRLGVSPHRLARHYRRHDK